MTLVIGAGRSGLAACHYLKEKQERVWLFDDRGTTPPSGVEPWTDIRRLPAIDRVIFSPGIPPKHPLRVIAKSLGILQEGELKFGLQQINPYWSVGITGTNGKTTVTEMASWVLSKHCSNVMAAGNIGLPVTELARMFKHSSGPERLILELSSYQLEDLSGPWLDVGVWLNLTPDHLDRYGSMSAYAQAKARLAHCIRPTGAFLVGQQVADEWGELLSAQANAYATFGALHSDLHWSGHQLMWKGAVVATDFGNFKTPHDRNNASVAAWIAHQGGMSWQKALDALQDFHKGPHRCEPIATINGVLWVNDSKGTNLDAVCKASEAFPSPQILIAGGVHKGAPYTPWIQALKGRIRSILAIGEAAPKIEADLGNAFSVEIVHNLDQAVDRAAKMACPGDTVLLSPGCASYDQFRDYAHRGEFFRSCVLQLVRSSDTVKHMGS